MFSLKRCLSLFFALLLVIVLYGCGDSESEDSSSCLPSEKSESLSIPSSPSAPVTKPSLSSHVSENNYSQSASEVSKSTSSSVPDSSPPESRPAAGTSESLPPAAPEEAPPAAIRDATPFVRANSAPGTVVYGNSLVSVDVSNSADGYIMLSYSGSNGKPKMQLTRSGGSVYTYNLYPGYGYQAFPLSEGSGSYTLNVFEHVSGTSYAVAFGTSFEASVAGNTSAFLRPNQFVSYNAGSSAVALGSQLAATASSELGVIENIYNWTINNITYDFNKAANVSYDYLPSVDSIIASGTGICFDYAAVMVTMLRTQNIPTKLVVGYAGSTYHAWISVYITDVGWIDNIIYFDGISWTRMDPTFASSAGNSSSILSYIGDGSNYNALFFY